MSVEKKWKKLCLYDYTCKVAKQCISADCAWYVIDWQFPRVKSNVLKRLKSNKTNLTNDDAVDDTYHIFTYKRSTGAVD